MRDRLYSASPTDASAQTPQATRVALIAGVLAVGLIVRWPWRDFVSDDWTTFLQYWQRFLIAFGGFPALRYAFSNYSAPYQYLLAITTQTLGMLPPMHQVKLVSVVFDVACAVLAYRLVAFYRPNALVPAVAFALVFLAPTVVLNSAAWAQADSIFTAFLLAALLALAHKRTSLALVLYAVSVLFKLQAGFLLPLFVFLALERRMPWRTFLLLPAVYALANVPALLAGRPLADALFVYSAQVGRYDDLTLKAPNLFQWLPPDPRASLQWFGFALAAGFVVSLWFVKHKLNNSITNYPLLIALALLIGLPFFLPRMHDRYFYVADVLSIVFACAFTTRRNVWPALVALAVNAASLAAYVAYLWEHDASVPKLPLTLAAAFMLVALIGTLWQIRPARHSHEGRNPDITPTSYLDSLMTHAHQVFWIPAFAGMAVVAVVLAAAIGGTVRAANDRIMLAATFERDGHGVRLDRAHATRCVSSDHVRIELSWIGSTLRLAPRTAIYSVFLHVYDAQGKRIAVADGYIDGKLPLNDVEFDLTEARDVKLDAPERSATIHVGVYAIESQVRLHATKPDGTPWDGDEVVIPIGEGRCRTE